jgi:hypothetical protein
MPAAGVPSDRWFEVHELDLVDQEPSPAAAGIRHMGAISTPACPSWATAQTLR